jgi:very-short-patch-repair endonuclease
VRQLPLPGRGRVRGIADGGYPDARIVLEADGRRWHDRVAAARRDRERDAQAARVGWQTLRWVYEQVMDDPAEVCATVRDTRQVRLDLFRRAA